MDIDVRAMEIILNEIRNLLLDIYPIRADINKPRSTIETEQIIKMLDLKLVKQLQQQNKKA